MTVEALPVPTPPKLRSGKFVEIRGIRLRIAVQGQGSPLLLINGLGANIEMWEPLRRLLTDRQTIAFDAPGAGASAKPTMPLHMRDLAEIVDELLDELGYADIDVLGYSLGGAVAQQLAHQHSQRVRRLVLAGATPGVGGVQNPVALLELLTLPLRDRQTPAHQRAIARVVGGQAARNTTSMAAVETAHQTHPPTQAGFAHQLITMLGWTSLPWLHTITAPTLVLAGEDDPLVPAINNKIFASLIPDCRQHIVPGAGHLFLIDQPEDAVEVIEEFLTGDQTSNPDNHTDASRLTLLRHGSDRPQHTRPANALHRKPAQRSTPPEHSSNAKATNWRQGRSGDVPKRFAAHGRRPKRGHTESPTAHTPPSRATERLWHRLRQKPWVRQKHGNASDAAVHDRRPASG